MAENLFMPLSVIKPLSVLTLGRRILHSFVHDFAGIHVRKIGMVRLECHTSLSCYYFNLMNAQVLGEFVYILVLNPFDKDSPVTSGAKLSMIVGTG